jgi:hypothetical protein
MQQQYRSFALIKMDTRRYIHTRDEVYGVLINTTSRLRVLGATGGQKGEIPKIESATEG